MNENHIYITLLHISYTMITKLMKKDNVLKELFGYLKFKKPTERILKEVREDLEG